MHTSSSTRDACDPLEFERWTTAGLDELTGPEDAPGLGPPPGLVDRLDVVTGRIAVASARLGTEVHIDGLETLAVRAEPLGLSRRGQVSCGGSCHLVRTADGWFAVSLSRAEDWELLPAWIDLPGDDPDRWLEVHDRCRPLRNADVVARGALLGLPIGALPLDPRPSDILPGDVQMIRGARIVVDRSTRDVDRAAGRGSRRADSIRVADLSSMWAGPLCGAVFAAAGAQVLKVESTSRPDGARRGSQEFYDLLNAGKDAVLVDLDTADGVRELEALLRSVDVVIESSRPRALEQLGIMADRLLVDPDGPDVWISVTGHGRDGADGQRVAFGDDAAVSGGLVAWSDGVPTFCADAIADPLTGLTAAATALEALQADRPMMLDAAMSRVAAHFAGTNGPDPIITRGIGGTT